MKLILFLSLLFYNLLYSQIDTTSLRFYPMQTGNYWEYEEFFMDWPIPMPSYSYYSIQVIGDTTLSNGLDYKTMIKRTIPNSSNFEYRFERIDSTTSNVYRYEPRFGYPNDEYLIDSLKSLMGDSSEAHRDYPVPYSDFITLCWDVYDDSVLAQHTQIKSFRNITYIPSYDYWLAKDIGLSKISVIELTVYECNLAYAVVDGQVYGKPLKINRDEQKPGKYRLFQNYPNPFNPITVIEYTLPKSEEIKIILYNNLGQKIMELYSGKQQKGHYKIELDGNNLPSGIYYYSLRTAEFTDTKKCILIK